MLLLSLSLFTGTLTAPTEDVAGRFWPVTTAAGVSESVPTTASFRENVRAVHHICPREIAPGQRLFESNMDAVCSTHSRGHLKILPCSRVSFVRKKVQAFVVGRMVCTVRYYLTDVTLSVFGVLHLDDPGSF